MPKLSTALKRGKRVGYVPEAQKTPFLPHLLYEPTQRQLSEDTDLELRFNPYSTKIQRNIRLCHSPAAFPGKVGTAGCHTRSGRAGDIVLCV